MTVEIFGSLNMDHIVYVERFPRPGETLLARRSQTMLGGKGANQAVAAARMGAASRLVGFVGDDEDGRALTGQLRAEGVDVTGVAQLADRRTGAAYILVDAAGENTIVVTSGANHPGVCPWPDRPAAAPTVVLTQFEVSLDLTRRFLVENQAARFRIINAAPFDAEGRALFDLATMVIVNETELAGYAGQEDLADEASVVNLARSLITHADQWIVVTLGPRGALAVGADEVVKAPAPPVQAIDTIGAGDCFAGALAAALAGGAALPQALVFATAAASLSVEKSGGATSAPGLEEVQRLVASRLLA